MSWDLNLFLTRNKQRTPFHYHLSPWQVAEPSPRSPRSFHRFSDLPTEIIFQIIQICDGPTWFQLMHVCTTTRAEASRLFWSQPDIWYYCGSEWWLSHTTGRLGLAQHCQMFANHVTQIEIDFADFDTFADEFREHPDGRRTWLAETPEHEARTAEGRATFFWDMVQKAFPSVQRVALTSNSRNEDDNQIPLAEEVDLGEYSPIAAAVLLAPSHIAVFVGFRRSLRHELNNTRLYRVEPGQTWTVVHELWDANVVMMPPRRISADLVSKFMRYLRAKELFNLTCIALEHLERESFARYTNGRGIGCPRRVCHGLRFLTRAEWINHLNQHPYIPWFDCVRNAAPAYRLSPWTPAEERAVFEERRQHAQAVRVSYWSQWQSIDDERMEDGSQKWLAQLREEKILLPGEALHPQSAFLGFLWARHTALRL
jgi:hypothetical protein